MYAKFHTPTTSTPRARRHRQIAAGVLGALATLAVIAMLASPEATAESESDGFTCEEITGADLVTGSRPGDTSSAPAAILGFNHAYYVDRSATRAQEFLTSDSVLGVDNRLQTGIDAVPAETRPCVSISPLNTLGDAERWAVTVTEFRPDIEPWVARQTVTTRTVDGRSLISEIALA
ncbi:hypothetical protein ACFVVM_16690 [Nocardia sp. NPDC058176]|uniref:hypothetical protein n=1 Tax=Nocardia sp. NPDC058176 TaxID=3346368 RepID=UPI0036DD275E